MAQAGLMCLFGYSVTVEVALIKSSEVQRGRGGVTGRGREEGAGGAKTFHVREGGGAWQRDVGKRAVARLREMY